MMRDADGVLGSVRPYELFMLCLSVFALVAVAANAFVATSGETQVILNWADAVVCGLFFIDFLISLYRAPRRLRYLVTWGWFDLLSAIPTIDILRLGRAARILRVFRLLRAVKAARILTIFILDRRGESAFLAATLLSILLVTLSSIAILQFETAPDSNIRGAGDAVWWAFVTLTTVGYGDRFPVTTEGRVVGVFLMIAGVGLFATLSGFIASSFLSPKRDKEEGEIGLLRAEIAGLRNEISRVQAPEPASQPVQPEPRQSGQTENIDVI